MSSTSWVFRGADLAGAGTGDVVVADGVIRQVGSQGEAEVPTGAEEVDASGLVLLPGLVDMHVHFRQPGREDAETIRTGSECAAAGGFVGVSTMPNTTPTACTAEIVEFQWDEGRKVGLTDVFPVGAVSKGLEGKELAELGLMSRSRANVRMFSDDGKCVDDPQLMRRALEYVRGFDGVVAQHAQDPRLAGPSSCCHEGEVSGRLGLPGWPGPAESVVVARDVALAQHTGARVHVCHMTTAESVEIVRWARRRGVQVTCEVTPHHLLLSTDLLTDYDPVWKVNPPLRPDDEIEVLREALADGTIDAVATDHAPHARQDKEQAFVDAAFGMVGLETSLSVISTVMVREGRMTWADVARTMSTNPARIAGMTGHGQGLTVGAPANLTLVDPEAKVTVDRDASRSLSRNNPWHGRTFTGAPVMTLLRGRATMRDGEVAPAYAHDTTNETAGAQPVGKED